MARRLLALIGLGLACGPAWAADKDLPDCAALVAPLKADPSSAHDGEPLLGVGVIVEDSQSTPAARLCTGMGSYRAIKTPITYTARWLDAGHAGFTVDGHDTTDLEAANRARTLRGKNHPKGRDGTYLLENYVPYCTDPEYLRLATVELHYGISFRDAFYREPDFRIFDIQPNGYGSGILSNCIATIGDDRAKGEVFIGTAWVDDNVRRRYAFYLLQSGPEGFKLHNRLWEIGDE